MLILCISQGSVVTHIRCGGKYDTSLVANLLLSPTVKEFFLNRTTCFKVMNEYIEWHLFIDHRVCILHASMHLTQQRSKVNKVNSKTWFMHEKSVERHPFNPTRKSGINWPPDHVHCGLCGCRLGEVSRTVWLIPSIIGFNLDSDLVQQFLKDYTILAKNGKKHYSLLDPKSCGNPR